MRGVPRREPMRGVPRRLELIELLRTRYPDTSERELLARILRGQVTVNGEKALKPGTRVAADAEVRLQPTSRFVSRGGEKLAAAIRAWNVDCAGAAWIDAGSSRGGFTDCLLQHGAPLVYAVDVGVGQLDWRLRTDRRVRAMEGTNILHVARAALDPPPGRAVADLSFRSLRGAARHILELTTEGWGIFLVAWGILVVGLIDNVVKPLFIKGGVEMHGAVVFFALLGGLAAFGPVGLVAGPLVVAFFVAVSRAAAGSPEPG